MRIILKSFFTLIILLGLQNCSPKMQGSPYSGQVNYVGKDASGTIIVSSIGYGSKLVSAITDAQYNAVNILLFKGLPGTELNVPLVENENESKSKHPDYYNRLFNQANYISYIMSTSTNSDGKKVNGTVMATVELKINYNSLRKDLEQNNVIRKFGF